jgi:hypothetical protein
MNVRTRSIAACALALFTATAVAALGSPAYAEGETKADLSLTTNGSGVIVDDTFKDLATTVKNQGPDASPAWTLEYDLSGLDDALVKVGAALPATCTKTGDTVTCAEESLAAGDSLVEKVPFTLEGVDGKSGRAGSFTVTAVSETDPEVYNNSATVNVLVPDKGVDLAVFAADVFKVTDEGEVTDEPVPPGESSFFFGGIGNFGDTTAAGIRVSVQLPEHVTFDEVEPGCTYTADNRTVTCDYTDINLIPFDQDTDPDDEDFMSVVGVSFPVKVAADAPGPVVLNGGTLSSFALGTTSATQSILAKSAKTTSLPKGLKALSAQEVKDANPSDNTDEFAVHVGALPATGGGGGGLPVTGAKVGLIGGIGGGVLAVGAVLFVMARRRRVVLVTPGDETPTV